MPKVKECRICRNKNLVKFLDLGFTPLADDFLTPERLKEPEVYYPLEVLTCPACGLAQLSYVVSPEILYQKDYPYESSLTKTGSSHFVRLAKEAVARFTVTKEDLAVDIGSNVGVLLSGFKKLGVKVQGIDPAANICDIARGRGIETINAFFSKKVSREIVKGRGKARIITATNVFAHVDDLYAFMEAVDTLLDTRGIFIVEAPYLLKLVLNLEYDTIYHEHLSYLSLKPLIKLCKIFKMELFDVEEEKIHGGSQRYFLSRKGNYKVTQNIEYFLRLEKKHNLYDTSALEAFSRKVEENREKLILMLMGLKRKGNKIAGISAPAKGMTLLNYCKIGPTILDFITEKSALKIGKFTPGTHIPVVADSQILKEMPRYGLLLAWNFAQEIMENLKTFGHRGAKFIIPIPEPKIMG